MGWKLRHLKLTQIIGLEIHSSGLGLGFPQLTCVRWFAYEQFAHWNVYRDLTTILRLTLLFEVLMRIYGM